MENTRFKISQYACAVLLIVSSIALVAYQVIDINDVAAGLLYYVAQSFLLLTSSSCHPEILIEQERDFLMTFH